MDEINRQVTPNPLVSWGITIAALGSLQDNLKEGKPQYGFGKMHVGVNFPYTEQTFPAIVMGINSLEVMHAGFYSAELTEPRNEVLKSSGEIGIDVYARNSSQLMTIVDYITGCYLLNMFDRNQMFYPGLDRSWIGMLYGGGAINWSPFALKSHDYTGKTYERLFETSTSIKFAAEHHVSVDLARITGVDIEAVPLNFEI